MFARAICRIKGHSWELHQRSAHINAYSDFLVRFHKGTYLIYCCTRCGGHGMVQDC